MVEYMFHHHQFVWLYELEVLLYSGLDGSTYAFLLLYLDCLTLEDRTYGFSQNVSNKVPTYAV